MCIRDGALRASLSSETVRTAVRITAAEYRQTFELQFDPAQLATAQDLYVILAPEADVRDLCRRACPACMAAEDAEIYITADRPAAAQMASLIHELLHFWDRHILLRVRPDLCQPDFAELERTHTTPGVFQTVYGYASVEWRARDQVQTVP
jgi:hypothetical protein